MPTHLETFWLKEYADVRRNYDPQVIGDREQSPGGCEQTLPNESRHGRRRLWVAWDNAFDHETEVSAIQHAINVWIDDGEDAFFSEMQNAPRPKIKSQPPMPTSTRSSVGFDLPRGEVPASDEDHWLYRRQQVPLLHDHRLGERLLWLDHRLRCLSGTEPIALLDEESPSTLSISCLASLSRSTPKGSRLTHQADHRPPMGRQDGLVLQVERLLIDANWGQSTDIVYQACREAKPAVLPSHGRGIGPTEKPLNDRRSTRRRARRPE